MSGAELTSALADRYRVERELGAGGMATVYLAHDVRHDRKVALKVLRPELAAVIGAERFLAEIRTTANLQHPHILPLFDSGAVDGLLYYVMPFIEGETVRDRLAREKQLPIPDAVRIASEVASALDYAHRHGVIHRDIKPENILLHDGTALVADFGIALAASNAGGTRMTETGMSLGTPHYMSPEQAMGERAITARSDVYALGAVTYEMLLGEPPFTGPTMQSIVAKVLAEKPARLTPRRERIPPEVEVAVLTALEKVPADRFATAAEFAAALKTPGTSAAFAQGTKAAKPRMDWRFAGVAGLIIGASVAAFGLPDTEAPTDAPSGARRQQVTFNGRSRLPGISPDGNYIAYVDVRCPRGPNNPCLNSLFVQERGNDRPIAVLRDVPQLSAPRFTHDGLSLVVSARLDADRDGLYLLPRLGGVPRRIGPPGVFDTHASADSVILVTRGRDGAPYVARIIALATATATDSVVLPNDFVHGIGWSPHGHFLAIVDDYVKVTIVRRNGEVADSILGPLRPFVRWTPNGSGILVFRAMLGLEDDLDYYAVGRDGRITAAPVVTTSMQTLLLGELDVARRSGHALVASGSLTYDLWSFDLDPASGPARRRTSGTTYYSDPAISPDGSRLYYQRGDATGDNLYELDDRDVEEALTAEPFAGFADPDVSRDGRTVTFGNSASSGARFGTMELASRQTTFFMESGVNSDWPAARVSRTLVYLLQSGKGLGIRDVPSETRRLLLAPDSLLVTGFAVDPSGDSVAVVAVAGNGTRLGVTPLAGWQPRWLHTFAPDEALRSLQWSNDGSIFFWLWPQGSDAPGVWSIRPNGNTPVRRRLLPTACSRPQLVMAAGAARGVCRAQDVRADVWFLEVPGVVR